MPGKKHRFTAKEDRQASHIATSMKARGKSPEEAKRIGYATVSKQKKRPSHHMSSAYRDGGGAG